MTDPQGTTARDADGVERHAVSPGVRLGLSVPAVNIAASMREGIMGFFGDFVLARSERPLLELPLFGSAAGCDDGHTDCLSMCWPRPGGWQTLQVSHGLPDNDQDRWLRELVSATGSPVMIASVMDSDRCEVRGLAPSGATWSVPLDLATAADHGTGQSERIAVWADEAGLTADREALLTALTTRSAPFVEDLFFQLVDACGLPASVAEQERSEDLEGPAHHGHRPDARCPRADALEPAVLNIRRDGSLVLECANEPDCYIQVWLRPDGTYQLEYRDRSPAEHYLTRTLSAEKVVAALKGWTAGEIGWRDNFQWNPWLS
ncbi:hypothetical protein ACEZCY_06130 [Streptacidiphilus sp. N1-12]|uniref:Uncharacterized protein n=2 Tax=Streptacidiphilus alkalitolerans TaxID=3342712 RepID=A0ABV6V5G7_9ACTN